MLSKDAMRGMNVVSAISDFLDESKSAGIQNKKAMDRVIALLEAIYLGARSYTDTRVTIDSFSAVVAEAVATDLWKTPAELAIILEDCLEKAKSQTVSEPCLNILRIIAKSAMCVTSRSVDTRSLVLH